jgi:hypothetical protein
MATCVDCQTETDKPYGCGGDNKRRCEKCAVSKYKSGIKNGVITLGIMPFFSGYANNTGNKDGNH